jgi:alkaline phosphatase
MHRKCLNFITQAVIVFAIIVWFPLGGFAAGPKNVIFYIGDGMSSVQRRITEEGHDKRLAMNTLPVIGMYKTDSLNTIVTDSAAAATAMATGYKTDNSVVSMDAWGEIAYETIAEAAKRLGKSVGIVTTTRLTHATPACFGSHVDTRNRENKIAEQYLDKNFEVWMGGGWRHFVPKSIEKSKRKDDRDLLKEFVGKGYTVVRSKSDLLNIKIDNGTKIFGIFSESHMPYFLDLDDESYEGKIPSLSEMTKVAISVLMNNPKGFFLMVEGGRIDHACHANDPVGVVSDMIDFDNAVKLGIDLSKEDPDTLILVGGDHETGGMAMGMGGTRGDNGYTMNPEYIKNAKRSAEFVGYTALSGKAKKAKDLLVEWSGISDLTDEETNQIDMAIGYAKDQKGMESPNPYLLPWYGVVYANIISKRARVGWTSYVHTGPPVIMSAGGLGSEKFAGYYDNTDIAKKLAALWGVTLKTWKVE